MFHLKFGNAKKLLVFLHGWGADLNSFLWLKNYFSDYSLLFLDFPGFGKSEEPHKALFVDDYVCKVKKIVDTFAADEIVLIGHSFGGRVAIKFAEKFQFCFKEMKVCLIDSAGIKPRHGFNYYFKVKAYKFCKKFSLKSDKFKKLLNKFGSSDYKKLSNVMRQTFVNVVNEDLSESAKNIGCETLIVWGKQDKETKLFMAKKLHKLIKNSKLVVFENAGHFSFLDNKREFLFLLDSFVKKQ